MSDDKIVLFPGTTRAFPAQTTEDLLNDVEETRRVQVESFVEHFATEFVAEALLKGYDLMHGSERQLKATAFSFESLKSALLQSVGIEHTLQPIAQKYTHIEGMPEEFKEQSPDTEDTEGT